jgi:adenine-specific DNA-methyltransferase
MADLRLDRLEDILLTLLPVDGSKVPNGQLRPKWVQAAAAAGDTVTEPEFDAIRDRMVTAGLVVKGPGRGGATGRAAGAAPGADDFELLTGEAPADEPAAKAKPAAKSKAKAPTPRAAADEPAQVISYRHADRRKNNPEVGLVSEASDPEQPKKAWAYNPHLDPVLNFDSSRAELENQVADALASGDAAVMKAALEDIQRRGSPYLQWAGKAERTSFEVDTVSLHVHERIDPMSILSAVRKGDPGEKNAKPTLDQDQATPRQASLFEAPFENLPLRDAVDFYRHDKGWANRLVSGDSLQVMNSLLVKEGMAGQVQMVYIDPPYGIKYGSNFQPFVGKRDVKDKSDADLTQEPEMIKAFRDTWELGIHSYLSYLRDRLQLARGLLKESGSVFVQISDDNLHHVREVMDEVFGAENFVAVVSFQTTASTNSPLAKTLSLSRVFDYIVWYAKSKDQATYRQLFLGKDSGSSFEFAFSWAELPNGELRRSTPELMRAGAELVALSDLTGQNDNQIYPINAFGSEFFNKKRGWRTTEPGIHRLLKANRIVDRGGQLRYRNRLSDFPVTAINNNWSDTGAAAFVADKVYVVETNAKVIERCLLMTTDPGDLVLDPTCGSGTTAFVAEKWGRRWITCDTSRVAITLAKQRLMTASFDYFELAYPHEGLKGGFIYKTVPHITLKSIANNSDIDSIYERLHPVIEEALAALNDRLQDQDFGIGHFVPSEGVRKGQGLSPSAGDRLYEWEVPFNLPVDWLSPAAREWEELAIPDAQREPTPIEVAFEAFHTARRRMQAEMDRAIAANAENETLYDQPEKSKTKLRITGPFTVEAVPFPTVLSLEAAEGGASATPTEDQAYQSSIARSGESNRQQQWRDELLKTGIRGKGGQKLAFTELDVMAGTTCLHATGTLAETGERVVVSFGPEHGALEQRQVEHALNEAGELFPRPKMIVFCAFTFDPEAAKDIDALKGITALKAQMNTDLLTEDLKKARSSNQSFWLMGQPDVALTQTADGLWQVEVNGFDYFDTVKGELISGGKGKIAMWSLDTDYDGRSLFPHQVFFPMAGKDEGWKKLKKTIRAELDESMLDQFHGTVSLPFEAGKHAKAAVKIVDDRGIESLKILPLVKGAA